MKVVQVSLRFDAPGGVETTVREVTGRLRRAGVDVRVFASDLYDEAAWERRAVWSPAVDGVPVRRFPVYRRLLPALTMPLMDGLVGALRDERADVVHAHSHRYGHVLQSAAVAEATGVPLIVSTHYHPADRREPGWKRGLLRLQDVGFGLTAYREARTLIAETELEAGLLREFAPADRIRVVPPGIDLEAWRRSESTDPSPAELPSSYILYAGRVASNKGLPHLLDAYARLRRTARPDLVLMGRDWGERSVLEARARDLGVSESVRFLGAIDDPARWRSIFRHASVFVLPSEWEAFGLVLLEAMAARCPIVASSVGGIPEVLQGGAAGVLVPYGDAQRLSDGIQQILDDQALAGRLVAGGTRRVDGLSWTRCVEEHLQIYRDALGG